MPFGLCNAAQTFHCLMTGNLQELPYVFVYFNDILVASSLKEEHVVHLPPLPNKSECNQFSVSPGHEAHSTAFQTAEQ